MTMVTLVTTNCRGFLKVGGPLFCRREICDGSGAWEQPGFYSCHIGEEFATVNHWSVGQRDCCCTSYAFVLGAAR